MKIYLTAVIEAKPQYLEEVKSQLEDMVIQTKKESACLQYDLHQSIENENVFVFYEIWENQAGLNAHQKQPYIKAFGKLVDEKLKENPKIYLTQKL